MQSNAKNWLNLQKKCEMNVIHIQLSISEVISCEISHANSHISMLYSCSLPNSFASRRYSRSNIRVLLLFASLNRERMDYFCLSADTRTSEKLTCCPSFFSETCKPHATMLGCNAANVESGKCGQKGNFTF